MAISGIGITTGLHTAYVLDGAILVDNHRVFDYVKKSLEKPITERVGTPGFRAIAGEFRNVKLALVQVPPYPQAVVEAVSELYILGARKIVLLGRGYRLTKRVSGNVVLIVSGAVPRDSMSRRIARQGLPLLASQQMLTKAKNLADVRFPDIDWLVGFTVTIDSARLKWTMPDAEDLVGMKGVIGVDSMVAPLYSLQYEYSNLEALAILTLFRNYSRVPTVIESSIDAIQRIFERETRTGNIVYTLAAEVIASLVASQRLRGR